MLRGIPTYRMSRLVKCLAPALAVGAIACATAATPSGFSGDDAGRAKDSGTGDDDYDSGLGGGFGEAGSFGDVVDIPPGDDDCVEAAGKYIYLVSDVNDMYTFDPDTVALNKLGTITCPGEPTPNPESGEGGVNSMAVDRHAIAWVNFADGKIFKVDTQSPTLKCTDAKYEAEQEDFTPQLGMGFATASAKSKVETLYVSDNGGPGGAGVPGGGKGLGSVDLSTMTMSAIGGWQGTVDGYNAELTGTGDGRLFGFFTTTPSSLGEIDKSTGKVKSVTPLDAINNSEGGYAFSFWAGDFYFYTAYPDPQHPDATTSITHYVPSTKKATVVKAQIGYTIVGAGVSTCAPTKPPN
jgi:hypothetical protein